MKQAGAGKVGEVAYLFLGLAVLVVATNAAEQNGLAAISHILAKCVVAKATIVSVVVQDADIVGGGKPLESDAQIEIDCGHMGFACSGRAIAQIVVAVRQFEQDRCGSG